MKTIKRKTEDTQLCRHCFKSHLTRVRDGAKTPSTQDQEVVGSIPSSGINRLPPVLFLRVVG